MQIKSLNNSRPFTEKIFLENKYLTRNRNTIKQTKIKKKLFTQTNLHINIDK